MPMFEYQCRACGKGFEELVRNAADEAELACPACGAANPERCLSACAVRVGSGGSPDPAPAVSGCGSGGFS